MFLTIAIVLLVLWALGFWVFPIAGGLIHILLVIADHLAHLAPHHGARGSSLAEP